MVIYWPRFGWRGDRTSICHNGRLSPHCNRWQMPVPVLYTFDNGYLCSISFEAIGVLEILKLDEA